MLFHRPIVGDPTSPVSYSGRVNRWLVVLFLLVVVGCSRTDPIGGRLASDLPPGPLQPIASDSATTLDDCTVLETSRGATRSQSDADFLEIEFTNRGDTACMVHGYPTLSLRNSEGRGIGDQAILRANGAARYIDLKPGETGVAEVRFPKGPAGCQSGTTQIEVLIPRAKERAYIDETHPYCPGWSVTAVGRANG